MVIDTEVRQALHEIRDELQKRSLHAEMNTQRIERLEELVADHLTRCNQQQEELAQILEVVRNVNASMKVANMIRRLIIWCGGLAAACFTFYRAYKGQ